MQLYIAEIRRIRQDPRPRSAPREFAATYAASAPGRLALAVVLAGAAAEILAVVALYQQSASPATGDYVLSGTIALAIIAVIEPTVGFARTLGQISQEDREADQQSAPAGEPPPEPGPSPET